MAGAAGHKQVDNILGPGREVRLFRRERILSLLRCLRVARARQQVVERQGAHPDAALFNEPAAAGIRCDLRLFRIFHNSLTPQRSTRACCAFQRTVRPCFSARLPKCAARAASTATRMSAFGVLRLLTQSRKLRMCVAVPSPLDSIKMLCLASPARLKPWPVSGYTASRSRSSFKVA